MNTELIKEFKLNILQLTDLTELQANHIITILLASEKKLGLKLN